jgi:hypothetical protein
LGSEKPAGFSGPFFHAKDRNRQMMPFFFMILSVKMQCRTARRPSGIALIKIKIPLFMQQRRPPPVAEAGRSCWGRGQQDMSTV